MFEEILESSLMCRTGIQYGYGKGYDTFLGHVFDTRDGFGNGEDRNWGDGYIGRGNGNGVGNPFKDNS